MFGSQFPNTEIRLEFLKCPFRAVSCVAFNSGKFNSVDLMRRVKRIKFVWRIEFVRDVVYVIIRRIRHVKCVLVSDDVVTSHRIKCTKVDFYLVQNVARATSSCCLRSSRMEPSRNLFNFDNIAVARATFCTKWKSTLSYDNIRSF